MIWYELSYIVFSVMFAWLNAYWIKKGRKIKHGWNGLLHIVAAAIAAYLYWLPCFFIILCNTRVFFDVSLNLFRGLGIDYVSPAPKSIADKFEKWLFDTDGLTGKIVCLLISFTLNTLYFVVETW